MRMSLKEIEQQIKTCYRLDLPETAKAWEERLKMEQRKAPSSGPGSSQTKEGKDAE